MVSFKFLESNPKHSWLLFIHGFGGSMEMWKKQTAILKDKFNICLINLPGHGGNPVSVEKMKSKNIFSDVAKDIIHTLKERGIEKVKVFSVSLGTLINYFMIEEDPKFVEQSVMTGAICGMSPINYSLMNIARFFENVIPYKMVINLFAQILMPKKSHKKSRTYLLQECLKMKKEHFHLWLNSAIEYLFSIKNSKLSFEHVELVSGDEDYVFYKYMQKFAELHKKVHLKVIEHCGHVCSLHKWREFNEYTEKLLLTN